MGVYECTCRNENRDVGPEEEEMNKHECLLLAAGGGIEMRSNCLV